MNNEGICKYCKKRIRFIRMTSGKIMPVDDEFVYYKLSHNGKDRIVTPSGNVVSCIARVRREEATGYGYISHFATCTGYDKKRVKRERSQ